jgi:hypothetical protein
MTLLELAREVGQERLVTLSDQSGEDSENQTDIRLPILSIDHGRSDQCERQFCLSIYLTTSHCSIHPIPS